MATQFLNPGGNLPNFITGLADGDTGYLHAGTHNFSAVADLDGSNITLASAPNETATIVSTASAAQFRVTGSNNTVRDLNFDATATVSSSDILVTGTSNTFSNCEFTNNRLGVKLVVGSPTVAAISTTIEDSWFYAIGRAAQTSLTDHCVWLQNVSGSTTVSGNNFGDCHRGYGVNSYPNCDDAVIEDNRFWNCPAWNNSGEGTDKSANNTFRRNAMQWNQASSWPGGAPSTGQKGITGQGVNNTGVFRGTYTQNVQWAPGSTFGDDGYDEANPAVDPANYTNNNVRSPAFRDPANGDFTITDAQAASHVSAQSPPLAPTGLSVTPDYDTQSFMLVDWASHSEVGTYKVFRAGIPGEIATVAISNYSNRDNIVAGQQYCYQVQFVRTSDGATSDKSTQVCNVAIGTPASPPSSSAQTSVYPTGFDSPAIDKQDNTISFSDHAPHHNLLGDAIRKMQQEMGNVPSGSYDSIAARFGDTLAKALFDAKGDLLVGQSDNIPVRFAPGASGEVLTSDPTTATGLKWSTAPGGGGGITNTLLDAKGDLIAASGPDVAARLPGPALNGQVLTADSAMTTGLKWAPPSGPYAYNIRDFGAVADGATDTSGIIQFLVGALPSTGGTIFIPGSVLGYAISVDALIDIGNRNVRIVGEGQSSWLKTVGVAGTDKKMFRLDAFSALTLMDLKITGPSASGGLLGGGGYTIVDSTSGVGFIAAYRVQFFQFTSALRVSSAINWLGVVQATDCNFTGYPSATGAPYISAPISCFGTTGTGARSKKLYVGNCSFSQYGGSSGGQGVVTSSDWDVDVVSATFANGSAASYGVLIGDITVGAANAGRQWIRNCVFETNTGRGVYSGGFADPNIDSNVFYTTQPNIVFNGGSGRITGNVFRGDLGASAARIFTIASATSTLPISIDRNQFLERAGKQISLAHAGYYLVRGNYFAPTPVGACVSYINLEATTGAQGATISGNDFVGNPFTSSVRVLSNCVAIIIGNLFTHTTGLYSVELNHVNAVAIVSSNTFGNSATIPSVTRVAGTIQRSGNYVFNAERGVAVSVADGGTITHGLGSTPSSVRVTPATAGTIAAVTALGATTFTVALKTAAGAAAANQNVYWQAEI